MTTTIVAVFLLVYLGVILGGHLVWQDRMGQRLVMATHDRDLALAARSFGFDVRGV